jgi:Arc/MetJ-type ribon-helix-helix transcriptional regulator
VLGIVFQLLSLVTRHLSLVIAIAQSVAEFPWAILQTFSYNSDMKTIAITIDERTLKRIDRLKADANARFRSRSEIIRQAAQEFVSRVERLTEEDREREIFRRNRKRLDRQSLELLKEQAKP